jgi:hypothetical protein
MRVMYRLALLLSSGGFFLFSCTGSTILGTQMIAANDARVFANGDALHEPFEVVVEPGEDGADFQRAALVEIDALRDLEGFSLLMSRTSGRIGEALYTTDYQLLSASETEQIIEVHISTDDVDVWSRYSATATTITPISSRMLHPGYGFAALAYALAIAFAIFFLGKILAIVTKPAEPEQTDPA